MSLKLLNEPILFQGRKKTRKYFEGWYFKQVSADFKNSISIIPGISIDTYDTHAFIQTIINTNTDSVNRIETHYHKFLIDDFKNKDEPFSLKIGNNKFKSDEIELDLLDDSYYLHGKIKFSKFTKIKTNTIFPSIMCSIAYIPFLGASFQGFICNLTFRGQEYRFASYNHSKLFKVSYTEDSIDIVIFKSNLRLEVSAKMYNAGILKAPKNGTMNNAIKEGLSGVVNVKLIKKSGETLFMGVGNCCGIELVESL